MNKELEIVFVQAAEMCLFDQHFKEGHILTWSLHTFEKFSSDWQIF